MFGVDYKVNNIVDIVKVQSEINKKRHKGGARGRGAPYGRLEHQEGRLAHFSHDNVCYFRLWLLYLSFVNVLRLIYISFRWTSNNPERKTENQWIRIRSNNVVFWYNMGVRELAPKTMHIHKIITSSKIFFM